MNGAKNYVKNQKKKRDKIIKEKKTWLTIQRVANRIGGTIPYIVFGVFVSALAYLLYYQFIVEVANVIDVVVAGMSVSVLIVSYARNKLNKRMRYGLVNSIYILLLTFGLIIFMVLALVIKDIGNIARALSCICLGVTIAQEITYIVKKEYEINVEGEHKQEELIKKIKSESITRV